MRKWPRNLRNRFPALRLGLSTWLPSSLGAVTYRTSVLHLQPRQMTLHITELGERRRTSLADPEATKSSSNFASSEVSAVATVHYRQ